MKTGDLLVAVVLAIIFAAVFASLFDLAPVIAKAMVRQAARWWKSELDTPEELAEEWEALVEERPVGILKIGTGLRFWVQGAIRLSLFAAQRQTTRASRLLMKLAEVPGLVLLKITEAAGLVVNSLRTIVSLVTDYLSSERSEPSHLLLNRRFRGYFVASTVSNIGTWLQTTAQVVLAYRFTHSVLAIGLVACAQFSSPLLLGPWAGVLAHRFGNWRALISAQLASAIITATLATLQFSGTFGISFLIAGATATGIAFTFALPAQSATVAALVPMSAIKRAMAMDSLSYNLGRVLGSVGSVFIIVTVGFGWIFALNAASFLLFTLVLLVLRPHQIDQSPNRSRAMNGLRIAWRDPKLGVLLLMVASLTVATDPVLVLGPALAGSFGASPDWACMFIAALGVGNVASSLRPRRREPSVRRAAATMCLLAAAMMVFVTSDWIWLSIAAAFAAGSACLMAGATIRMLLMGYADPSRQAAVMAAWAVAWAGSKSLASLADGSLASLIGVRPTGVLLAMPALVPALVLVFWPTLAKRLGDGDASVLSRVP